MVRSAPTCPEVSVLPSRPIRAMRAPETPPALLAKLLARGSAWALAGYGASQVFRLGLTLVLWRLLVPDVFGLMAIVSAVMQGLAMFSDVGIGPSIIQYERG